MMEGLLLVNKPSGPTSYDLIRWIKRKTGGTTPHVKIGHCGTLDPLASGLMILLLGWATKKQGALMGHDKVYRCGLTLGLKTDSGDITGKTIATAPVPTLDATRLSAIAQKMTGPQLQTPPMYSAIKKEGTPLYKLARKGQTVERRPRPVTIHDFSFLGTVALDRLEFRVRCTAGTYVRTLAEDVGAALGSVATMASLVREKIGDFSLDDAIDGERLKKMDASQIAEALRPVEAA